MKAFLISLIVILSQLSVSGQSFRGVNITAGVGLPDVAHVGGRLQLSQSQYGGNFGKIGSGQTSNVHWSLYHVFNYGGSSKHTEIKPWYLRHGLSGLKLNREEFTANNIFYDLRLGREMNFSPHVALTFDFGLLARLGGKVVYNSTSDYEPSTLLPAIGLTLLGRLYSE